MNNKLSNNSAITALKNLDVQEIYYKTTNYVKLLKEAQAFIKKSKIDLLNLPLEERQALGFRTWSKESGEYELIPLYISKLLPKGTLVYCPLFENSTPKPVETASDDIRAGCIAYQLYKQTNK